MSKLLNVSMMGILICLSSLALGQGFKFSDTTSLRQAVMSTDGNYFIRSEQAGSRISKIDADNSHLWTKEYFGSDIYPFIGIYPDDANGFIAVSSAGASEMPIGEPVEHYIGIYRIDSEGNVVDAKQHGIWIDTWTLGSLHPFSNYGRSVTRDGFGNIFITLAYGDGLFFPSCLMKVNSDGTLGWCRTISENSLFLSDPIATNDGGCVTIHQMDSDDIVVTRYATDGDVIWSKRVERTGYMYFGPFNGHQHLNGDLSVLGTSGKNLVKMKFSSTGALEEHVLVAPIPTLPLNIQPSLIGSSMSEDESIVAFADDHIGLRITRFDPAGALMDVHSAPAVDSSGWTTKHLIDHLHDQGDNFTVIGKRVIDEPIFGFNSTDHFVLTSTFDLSSFCFLAPAQYAITTVPMEELEISDVAPFPTVPLGLTTEVAVNASDTTAIAASAFCSLSTTVSEVEQLDDLLIFPNPVAQGERCIIRSQIHGYISVRDVQGRGIYHGRLGHSLVLETDDLVPGLYLVQTDGGTGGRILRSKLVVE